MVCQTKPHNFSCLFEQQASKYKQFRPTYPKQLYNIIFDYHKCQTGVCRGKLAVDVATGNGQVANQLAKHFDYVVGIDSSQSQIQNALSCHQNVQFLLGDGHYLPFDDNSVDMITVAAGLHWFQLEQFYQEAARVLKHNCSLAAWCYHQVKLPDYPDGNILLNQFSFEFLKDHWNDRALSAMKKYDGMEPNLNLFTDFQKIELKIEKTSSLAQLKGFLETLSAYNSFMKQGNYVSDPLPVVIENLQNQTNIQHLDFEIRIQFPVTLFLMRKIQ